MTAREAWLITLVLVIVLLAGMALAGAFSEWIAPAIPTEIGNAWSQSPR